MYIYSDFTQVWRIEKHESGNSFGGGMSEEVETLGEAPPPSVTPLPEFLDPPLNLVL